MLEILAMPLMQRALLAGLMVGFLASYYGVFVVQRGLSFLGSGLAHAAFGGVALGILLQWEPLWVAIPFTCLIAVGIIWLQERSRLNADTAIGIFFSVAMALGIIFLAKAPQSRFSTDAMAYLFGSVLAIQPLDLWITAGAVVLSIATWPLWGRWSYATFDRELARSDSVPALRDDYLLSLALAITIVISIKVVGITLMASFLVIPAATARMLARTFSSMTVISVLVGTGSVLVGMALAVLLDWPPGAAVIMVQSTLFAVAMVVGRR